MTKIDFIKGFDPVSPVPKAAVAAGLRFRFAVVQHTYRAEMVDMYFDEPLWARLIEFVRGVKPDSEISVMERAGAKEVPLGEFEAAWRGRRDRDLDREPPEFVFVRVGTSLTLCMATEYWAHVGGPPRYADSYTYSIFSAEDVSADVVEYLAKSSNVCDWKLGSIESIS